MEEKMWKLPKNRQHLISICLSLFCMGTATGISCLLFYLIPENTVSINLIYILFLVLVSRYSVGYLYGILCSLASVVCVNYLFTYPFFKINFSLSGYPITFLVMLAISLLTSTMTSHLAQQTELIMEREKMLAEAEKEKMRANLLRTISHDLRTPLTGIIGNSSVYLENNRKLSEEEKIDILSNIYNDSNWLLNMVENLLAVTRIRGENLSIITSEESVEEVLGEALQKLNKRYADSSILVQVPDDIILLPMDAILVEQVIINLLENAIVHSHSRKPIELYVDNHPTDVSFVIKDYGIGIPEERLNNLFDGFTYTPSQSSDAHKGMGIGLSICKTIITAHQGTLIGRNHKEGAEFKFTLPKMTGNA